MAHSILRHLNTSGLRLLKTSYLQITVGRGARSGPRVYSHLLKFFSPLPSLPLHLSLPCPPHPPLLPSPPLFYFPLFPFSLLYSPLHPPVFRSLSASVFPSVKWRQHLSETPFCLPGMIWERVRSCLGRLGELQRRPKINSRRPNCLEEQRPPQPQFYSPIIMGEGESIRLLWRA